MDLGKARDLFIQEAHELLQQFEELLLKAESQVLDKEDLGALFRTAHTIKGSAGLFGFDAIVLFTHTVENALDRLRNGTLELTAELSDLLLQCRDGMVRLVTNVESGAPPSADLQTRELALQNALKMALGETPDVHAVDVVVSGKPGEVSTAGSMQRWHIHARFGADVIRNGVDPIACLRYLTTLGKISALKTEFYALPELFELDPEACYIGFDFDLASAETQEEIESTFDFAREGSQISVVSLSPSIPRQADIPTPVVGQDKKAAKSASVRVPEQRIKPVTEHRSSEGRFIKVEASKLDTLINLVGELVIAGASANVLASLRGDVQMQENISVLSSLVEQIRDGALDMRMVPMGEVFQRFPRVVRDVSLELGKEIELRISGEETELDKSMVEKLTDPLMHILRNSLDHGVESVERRLENGKPARAVISMTAYHESGCVVIEVQDDGGGIRRDKVLNKAIERGLVEPNANLSDQEVYHLLFEAGFSTADAVTNLSGRGVGMDVVKKNIEALRGEIEIESEEDVGTLIRLRLPLTLAIIDGFLVKVGASHFVIPLDMVLECIELTAEASQSQHYIELRGEVLPYVDVRELFGVEAPLPTWRYIVVVQYGTKRAGLVVDSLMGELQVVIKPLGKLFRHIRGIGGSAILGSGDVALILDVPQMVQLASTIERNTIMHIAQSNIGSASRVINNMLR